MKLGLLAIFRNESHILDEFISFYRLQGVDHFYLINNASEDNYLPIIKKHSSYITLYHDDYVESTTYLDKGGPQIPAYNRVLRDVNTEWLYVCDLDEFAYTRLHSEFYNIKNFIEKTSESYDQVLIPLRIFNSGGLIEQPSSVIKGFTQGQNLIQNHSCLTKPIAKTELIEKILINFCIMKNGSITANSSLESFTYLFNDPYYPPCDHLIPFFRTVFDWNRHHVVSNHYVVQSYEWFWTVKAKRGTATWHGGPSQEASEWFSWVWDRYSGLDMVYEDEVINVLQNLKCDV